MVDTSAEAYLSDDTLAAKAPVSDMYPSPLVSKKQTRCKSEDERKDKDLKEFYLVTK